MSKVSFLSVLCLFAAAVFSPACKKGFSGSAALNKAPETFMVVDTIVRAGDNRFKSVVEIRWWGNDEDGYVKGYEFSFDGQSWTYTQRQDSTFNLSIPGNADTIDFRFYVRAIDNEGLADPTPASLNYPVKNSNPALSFIIPQRNPQRSFPALKFYWQGTDPDGNNTLDKYEALLNDTTGTPYTFNASVNEVMLVASDPAANISACVVYAGTLTTPAAQPMNGLLLNRQNILYVRAVDKVGARSPWMPSSAVFVKKPVSDILFINAQRAFFNRANIESFYSNRLFLATNKSFDTLQAGPENALMDLSPDPATQDRVFSFFKKIFVYSENAEFVMSLMQRSSSVFFANGGKIMLVSEGNDVLDDQPAYLSFAPANAFTARPDGVSLLLNAGDSLVPVKPGYPALRLSGTILTGLRPFDLPGNNTSFNYEKLYGGIITQDSLGNIGKWKGNATLVAKRIRKTDNQADFVLCLLPMNRFANNAAIDAWFRKLLVDELAF